MHSDPSSALHDIAYHIDLANRFVADVNSTTFETDLRTLYAVVRCLEIISEASRRLPLDLKQRHTAIAWRDMAASGNIYRHDYEDVEARQVWEAVKLALPPLKTVVDFELVNIGRPTATDPA